MKKILLFILLFIFISKLTNSQGRINMYLFGYGGPYRGTMNLYSGSPIVTADSINKWAISLTHANISNLNGQLLFFTNGAVLINGNYDTMPNGTGLNPCSYTSSCPYGLINIQG